MSPACLFIYRTPGNNEATEKAWIVIWRLQIIQYNAANPIILLFMTFHSRHLLEVSSVFELKLLLFCVVFFFNSLTIKIKNMINYKDLGLVNTRDVCQSY